MELNAKKIALILFAVLVIGILSLGILGIITVSSLVSQPETPPADIAVIDISGPIIDGGETSPWGTGQAQAGKIMEQINRARENQKIKALLLRVNSPGGSSAASDAIYRELKKFSQTERPIVVSMGDMAASGGYYVSCLADQIYANPATITGSIGTIMQFQNLAGLYDKLGIKQETIKSGKYKDIGNPNRSLTEEERRLFEKMIDQIYNRFVEVVVQGRGLKEERVKELADGRVYTGLQAKEVGLIDKLGTYYDARKKAAALAGIEEEPRVIEYGKPSLLERILSSTHQLIFSLLGRSVSPSTELNEIDTNRARLLHNYLLQQERYSNLKLEY